MNKTNALDLHQGLDIQSYDSCVHTAVTALHLRFSGYDPRAAGGRQTLKLELRGDLAPGIHHLRFQFRSELLASSHQEQSLLRTPAGMWPPMVLAFSSRNKEHGQYPLEVQLHYQDDNGISHLWTCTSTIFLPRANASLSEIHQVFLATQKNVRVVAEDGAIAKLHGLQESQDTRHANLDIAIYARDAAIAQVDMTSNKSSGSGKFDIGLGSLAWDEEMLEVAVPNLAKRVEIKLPTTSIETLPAPQHSASLLPSTIQHQSPQTGIPFRLFALEEWVLGRMDTPIAAANILFQHQNPALTRRLSAKHAVLRRTDSGNVEITDTSRYGVLLDQSILEKHQPIRLLAGMQIELCASFKGIVQLRVAQILPHAVVLQRMLNAQVSELIYLIAPERRPENGIDYSPNLPVLFHRQGQFWLHDASSQQDLLLANNDDLHSYHDMLGGYQYHPNPYPQAH